MFLDVLYGDWGNFFPLRPTSELGIYDGPVRAWPSGPGNNQFFDGGANSSYQDQKRYKPQFYVSLSYFKDGWRAATTSSSASTRSATAATSSRTSRSTSSIATRPAR